MDLENNIWTSFWKWNSSQTTWPWQGPLQMKSCFSSAGLGWAWWGLSVTEPLLERLCCLPASKRDSSPSWACLLLPSCQLSVPQSRAEQWAPLAFFFELLLQCQGGCQNLRKERLKLKAWLPNCGSIVGHLGFLKLIVDEELNNFNFPPEYSSWSFL